jgi:phosphonate transport system ATP-binding protein
VPAKLTPEVVRDVYGAEKELDESVTSTAIADQVLEVDPEPVKFQLVS